MQPVTMEPMRKELLTRYEITNILAERHLKIPNIDSLSYGELLHIYETFAVPLEQRELKQRTIDISEPQPKPFIMVPKKRWSIQDLAAHARVLNDHSKHHYATDPHLLQQTKYLKLTYNTISLQATKRQASIGLSGEVSPAKRTYISWP